MLERFATLIESREGWLMERILHYAIEHGYSRYSSTLKEPWRLSICGLSKPLIAALRAGQDDLALHADGDDSRDPAAVFGILEAQRHRERGVDMRLFLGLFKYYRQTYRDLLETAGFDSDEKSRCRHFLERFFDRIEIGLCSEWVRVGEQGLLEELQRTNRRMANEKNKYLTVFESLADPVIVLDEQLRITDINEAAATLFGVQHNRYGDTSVPTNMDAASKPVLLGREAAEAIPWLATELQTFTQAKEKRREFERAVQTSNGGCYLQVKLTAMRDVSRKYSGTIVYCTNISARKRMEQDFIRSQRLRAIGELASGISHNLNNVLTAVLTPAMMLKRQQRDPKFQAQIELIVAGSQRAADLVRQFRHSIDQQSAGGCGPVSVNEVVAEVVRIGQSRWKDEPQSRGITLEVVTELQPCPQVRATSAGLFDVITSLCFNALEAMPAGGTITLSTTATAQEVMLAVRDTGVGMDEETRTRIFEPFFSTKLTVGHGLGLSTAYAEITKWGGRIEVESAPDKGSVFSLHLPVFTDPGSLRKAFPKASGDRGRLLVVEDDALIGKLLRRLLATNHELELFASSQAALKHFDAGTYQAAVIDLGLPALPGDALARHLRGLDPALATVLITGWDLAPQDPRRTAFDFCLNKPFRDLAEVEAVVGRAVALGDQRACHRSASPSN